MYPIILIQASLQRDTLEEKRHKNEIVLLRESWKYRLIGTAILSSEIEWRLHACEKYLYIFRAEFFDDGADIFLDFFDWLSLKGVIGSYTEDHKRWCISLECPVQTREESCGRISGDSGISQAIAISTFSELRFELTRV